MLPQSCQIALILLTETSKLISAPGSGIVIGSPAEKGSKHSQSRDSIHSLNVRSVESSKSIASVYVRANAVTGPRWNGGWK